MIDKSVVEILSKEEFAKISRWNRVTLLETNRQTQILSTVIRWYVIVFRYMMHSQL